MNESSEFLYHPRVSLSQMLAFDPERPETHTGVRVVDLVLRAFYHLGQPTNLDDIAELMGLKVRTLREAIRMETGTSFLDFIEARDMMKLCVYYRTHTKHRSAEIVSLMGYAGESSYWRFRQGPRYKRNLARHQHLLETDPLYRELFEQKSAAGLQRLKEILHAQQEIRRLEQEIKLLS